MVGQHRTHAQRERRRFIELTLPRRERAVIRNIEILPSRNVTCKGGTSLFLEQPFLAEHSLPTSLYPYLLHVQHCQSPSQNTEKFRTRNGWELFIWIRAYSESAALKDKIFRRVREGRWFWTDASTDRQELRECEFLKITVNLHFSMRCIIRETRDLTLCKATKRLEWRLLTRDESEKKKRGERSL